MSIALGFIAQLLHILLILAAAPTVAGITGWLEARLDGLSGPPVLLPWRTLISLSRKTPTVLESNSPVARLAPAVGFGATLTAAVLVPSFTLFATLSPVADVLVIVSLLALARAAGAVGTFDAGAARSGLRQQNAGALAVIAEPAALLSIVAVALMAGTFNLDAIIAQQRDGTLMPVAASLLAMIALGALFVAEALPVDDSLSGTDLALALATGWLRRLAWIDLICGLFLPVGIASADSGPLGWLIGLGFWVAKLLVVVLALAGLSSLFGRIPRHSLPGVLGVAALLALLAVIMVLAGSATA
jgi:formate hydrogenlyase subunit 4